MRVRVFVCSRARWEIRSILWNIAKECIVSISAVLCCNVCGETERDATYTGYLFYLTTYVYHILSVLCPVCGPSDEWLL